MQDGFILVQGNYIGTDVTGNLDLGNGVAGVVLVVDDRGDVGGATDERAQRDLGQRGRLGVMVNGRSRRSRNRIQGNGMERRRVQQATPRTSGSGVVSRARRTIRPSAGSRRRRGGSRERDLGERRDRGRRRALGPGIAGPGAGSDRGRVSERSSREPHRDGREPAPWRCRTGTSA